MRDSDADRQHDDSDLDPMVAAYMAGIDGTLLRENLELTPTERVEKLMALQRTSAGAFDLFGRRCHCLDLSTLIRTKAASGRPKDLEAIAALETLRRRT